MPKQKTDLQNVELMDPKVDFVFKSIFGNEKYPGILISFLNAVFRLTGEAKIIKVRIENPNLDKRKLNDKYSILDVKATANDNTLINIEIQINDTDMISRSVFYLSRLISGQLKEKDEYRILNKSVAINILNFDIFKNIHRMHNAFLFKEVETNQVLTDLAEIHFIELPKINFAQPEKDSPLMDWLLFIDQPESKEVEMITHKNAEIQQAKDLLYTLSMDKEARAIYEARQKAQMDMISSISKARRDGIEEGELKGINKGKEIGKKEGINIGKELGKEEGIQIGAHEKALEIARNMIKSGMSLADVSKITGIPEEEIK